MEIDLRNIAAITNNKFYPEYNNTDRYLVFFGGGDSGKSHFCATKLVARCLRAKELGYKHKFLVTRKTQPAVRKSAFVLVQDKISLFPIPAKYVKTHQTMMEITIFDSKIIFVGLDDREKIKSIEGLTGAWEEEPTELHPDDHTQLDLRIRGFAASYMQIMTSFNPIDIQNWLNREYFTGLTKEGKPRPDFEDVTPADWPKYKKRIKFESIVDGESLTNFATTVHSTIDDNRWALPAGKAVLENLKYKDPNYYKVYRLGEWGVLKGLVFERWDTPNKWPKKFDIRAYGLDFGFTNHPSGMLEVGIIQDEDEKHLYLREIFYKKGLTNADIADIMPEDSDETPTIADNAEPKSITELCRCGKLVLPCKKGKDSIIHGIQKLKQFNIHIHPESISLIKEFRAYKWAVDKNGEFAYPPKPVDFMNHLIDPARYATEYLTNYIKVNIEYDDDPREERKAEMREDDYSPLTDESQWEDFD